MGECPFGNAALNEVKLRHLWGLSQERLHFVDVGASYLNTSAAHFVRGYPRGHEFTVHLIEGNPRIEYTRRLARGVGIKYLGNVTRACAWTEDGVEFHSEGFATVPDVFPIGSVVRTTPTHRLKHLVAQIPPALRRQFGCTDAGGVTMDCQPWSCTTIDLARWMRELFSPGDFVVLKIDAEGAEWRLLPHLLRADAAQLVDEMWVEWHHDGMPNVQAASRVFGVNGLWGDTIARTEQQHQLTRAYTALHIPIHDWH